MLRLLAGVSDVPDMTAEYVIQQQSVTLDCGQCIMFLAFIEISSWAFPPLAV
jgi:hypothetical protein